MRCSPALSALLATIAAVAQEPAADPNLPGQIKELHTLVKDPKMAADLRACDLVQILGKEPDKRSKADLDKVASALGDVWKLGKVRPPDNARLYEQTADVLGTLGKRGSKPLRSAIDSDRIKSRDYQTVRARIAKALGATKDKEQVEFLLELALRSPDDEVLAAAGGALAHFPDLDTPKLREIVKKMIGRLNEWSAKASQLDPTDPNAPIDLAPENARKTLDHVREPWHATLKALTGQSFTDPADWQRWQNKNRDWTPPGRKS